jgi:hypothetical protein
MGEVLRQDLASGRLLDLDEDLPDLLVATHAAQEAVRQVVGDLRTTRAAIRNVARAIRSCADQLEEDGKPRIDLKLAEVCVSEQTGLVLLQVTREALVNASRYSGTDRIRVNLEESPNGWADLSIADDGVGFDLAAVDDGSHFGIQLMRERVEAVGGRIEIVSSPGLGTVVYAAMPLQAPAYGNETTPPDSEGVESDPSRRLAGPPVGATGESQGRDRRECECDAAHKLHVECLLLVQRPPFGGHIRNCRGTPSGGQAPEWSTAFELTRHSSFKDQSEPS